MAATHPLTYREFEAILRERKCLSCREPCRNVRHPDTDDYDRTLPECRCCKDTGQYADDE